MTTAQDTQNLIERLTAQGLDAQQRADVLYQMWLNSVPKSRRKSAKAIARKLEKGDRAAEARNAASK